MIFIVVCVIIGLTQAELTFDEDKKPISSRHTIRNTCTLKTDATVHYGCVRYPNPNDNKYLRLQSDRFTWQIFPALEGDYHIGKCEEKKCLFWKKTNNSGRAYIILTSEPVTRFRIKFKAHIEHKQAQFKSKSSPSTIRSTLRGKTYTIEAVGGAGKYKFVSYKSYMFKDWLVQDRDSWNWVISPGI